MYKEISSVVGVEMLVLLVTARSDLFAAALAGFVLFGIALELDVEPGWNKLDDVSVVLDVDEDLGLLLSWLLASWSSSSSMSAQHWLVIVASFSILVVRASFISNSFKL